MSNKPMGPRRPARDWQESKDMLDAENRRGDWLNQTTLTVLAIFFAIAIPAWFIYMAWATFGTVRWLFGR